MGVKLEPGVLIAGRYRLERPLGEGGMGSVWAATHAVTRRGVALKFLGAHMQLRPEAHRRFLREARAAAAVDHPNVVQVHDVFELDEGVPVMVMDLLEGQTFGRKLARDAPLELDEVAPLLLPVVSAVGTAHSLGVVHRDLKPENVFLATGRDGEPLVKVLDFGIAKLTGDDDHGTITGTGTTLGTPCYMAPEQGFGEKDFDHRVDVWAIGVLLYEALSGGRPVEGETLGQVLKRLMNDAITPIEALVPDLPSDVAALVMAMLSREKEDRPDDLREVKAVLEQHASVAVPDFGPPSSGAPASTSGERIVVEAGADPDSATAAANSDSMAAPDTAGAHSVTIDPPPSRRRALIAAGGAVAIVLGVVGWRVSASSESTAPEAGAATDAQVPAVDEVASGSTANAPEAPTGDDVEATGEDPVPESEQDAGGGHAEHDEAAGDEAPKTLATSTARRAPAPTRSKPTRSPRPTRSPEPASTKTTAPAPAPTPAPHPRGGLVEEPPF